MAIIVGRIGEMKVSREWNRRWMSDHEFADFWRGTHEGDIEAKLRHDASRGEQMKKMFPAAERVVQQ
jgi:hypothetical protein